MKLKKSLEPKLEIEFLLGNKPDAKKAAKLLGPILCQMLEKKRLQKQLGINAKS